MPKDLYMEFRVGDEEYKQNIPGFLDQTKEVREEIWKTAIQIAWLALERNN